MAIRWNNVAGLQDQTQGFARAGALFDNAATQMQTVLQDQIDQETTANTFDAVQRLRGAGSIDEINQVVASLSGRLDHNAINQAVDSSRNFLTQQDQNAWQRGIEEQKLAQTKSYQDGQLGLEQSRFDYTKSQDAQKRTDVLAATDRANQATQNTIAFGDGVRDLNTSMTEARKNWLTPAGMTTEDGQPIDVSSAMLKTGVKEFNPSDFYSLQSGEINREGIYDVFASPAQADKVIASMERNILANQALNKQAEQQIIGLRNQYGTVSGGGITQTSEGLASLANTAISGLPIGSPLSNYGKARALDKSAVKDAVAEQTKVEARDKVFADSPVLDATAAVEKLDGLYRAALSNDPSAVDAMKAQSSSMFQTMINTLGIPLTGKDLQEIIANSATDTGTRVNSADNKKFFEATTDVLVNRHFGRLNAEQKKQIKEQLTKAAADNYLSGSVDEITGASEAYLQKLTELKLKFAK